MVLTKVTCNVDTLKKQAFKQISNKTHSSIEVARSSPQNGDRVFIIIVAVSNGICLALTLSLIITVGRQLRTVDGLDEVLVLLGVEISESSLTLNLCHDHEPTEVLPPVTGLQGNY